MSDVEAALKNSLDEYFCGWEYLDTDGQYKHLLVYSELGKPQAQFITVDDALFEANGGSVIPLYPYCVSAHFLHFDSNAGGELLANDSTWFYVDPEKNETIKEYHPTRDYRLDMHNGTYYYHYDPWDPLGDKHVTDTNSPSFIPDISRRAYYTLDIAEATSNEFSNPVNRYVYDPGAYAFMGWFEVLADGTLSIDPDGRQTTVTLFDPEHHATGNIEDGYVADAETTLTKAPAPRASI